MLRWYLFLSAIVLPTVVFACADEAVQEVDQSVCLSGKQWIGGKRGDPRMYPGRDCVGCHLENDGPELMLGGTIYPYVQRVFDEDSLAEFKQKQSGEDCFGLKGVKVTITGRDGQTFEVTTNEAGNFFVEGKATDLAKPIQKVELFYQQPGKDAPDNPSMTATPSYGGCARCHRPGLELHTPDIEAGESQDLEVGAAFSYVGIPSMNNDFFSSAPAR